MMAALDGELADDERREWQATLEAHPEIEREFATMARVKEVTGSMSYRNPPEEMWDGYWRSTYNRLERGVGWIVFSIGAVMLLGFAAWNWVERVWGDGDVPLLIRLAILAVAVGLLIVAFSVVREKLFTRRHDPYREIER
jgi:ferric-dicitrate binding protein FerR (iron transport regulator)